MWKGYTPEAQAYEERTRRAAQRGRVLENGRWYKDGYAPSQLPSFIRAWCGRCGRDTLTISARGSVCAFCTPSVRAD